MADVVVDGIVAVRDRMPYVRLLVDGQPVAHLSMAEARKVALDILQMSARTEADAMLHLFFSKQEYPSGAAVALMLEFRDFRTALDAEPVEGSLTDPDTGERV